MVDLNVARENCIFEARAFSRVEKIGLNRDDDMNAASLEAIFHIKFLADKGFPP